MLLSIKGILIICGHSVCFKCKLWLLNSIISKDFQNVSCQKIIVGGGWRWEISTRRAQGCPLVVNGDAIPPRSYLRRCYFETARAVLSRMCWNCTTSPSQGRGSESSLSDAPATTSSSSSSSSVRAPDLRPPEPSRRITADSVHLALNRPRVYSTLPIIRTATRVTQQCTLLRTVSLVRC